MRHTIQFLVADPNQILNVHQAANRPEFNNDSFKIRKERLRFGSLNSPIRFHIDAKFPRPLKNITNYSEKAKELLDSSEAQSAIRSFVKNLCLGNYENAAHELESIKNALELLKDKLEMNTDNPGLLKPIFC